MVKDAELRQETPRDKIQTSLYSSLYCKKEKRVMHRISREKKLPVNFLGGLLQVLDDVLNHINASGLTLEI